MKTRALSLAATLAALLLLLAATPAPAAAAKSKTKAKANAPASAVAAPAFDPALFKDLPWREVGPYRGGRSAAVEGLPSQPLVYYFGGTGGGVWKSTDGGASWSNVSDGYFGGSIGSIAVSEWDPNVVYVGGGEVTVRGNVSHGDGVWKSTDAGKSWTHVGLEDSRHIPRIRIHPKNPDLVYAAVLGHLFGPSEMRGVYRSKDGGKSWERILYAGPDAGAVDLAMDPTNPRILYASTWRVRRTPYSLESGGAGSGLWKSTDGGDTWKELSRNKGLPTGTLGIIGITVSPTNPQNLYAIVEADKGGVFRSQDGGDTWTPVNAGRDLRQRAWYYSRIYADPKDEDTVYVVNVRFHRSKDGGKSFQSIRTPHGDNHDLWIAPGDPLRMIEANDGGVNVSTDGGETWTGQDNQPTAQLYRVSTDNDFPYRLLGAQQDNSSVRIRHRSLEDRGIGPGDWEPTAGGESGFIVARPDAPEVVYGGSYGGFLMMYDHKTGAVRDVNAWPDNPMGWGAADLKYRFQWNFPLFFSPHDAKTLYAAANVLFKSTDGGASWQVVSPDLTRDDKSKMGPSGGPITKDNTSIEYYGTIFAALESPLEPGLLWAGSDDGLIHLSRDGGATWSDVTPKEMPQWAMVNSLEASPFQKGGLYVAATKYKWDDFNPYLYKTSDYGKTWTKITGGLPEGDFTRVVRADPKRPGLLFAGTEHGVWVSFDDGGSWQSLQGKLPLVPVTDLAIRDGDLIAATQGRGFWMLDDIAALEQVTPELAAAPFHLFTPAPAWRLDAADGKPSRNQGTNPPAGLIVDYLLKEPKLGTKVKLELLKSDGSLIRDFSGEVKAREDKSTEAKPVPMGQGAAAAAAAPEKPEEKAGEAGKEGKEGGEPEEEGRRGHEEVKLEPVAGLNRFAWDLRYPDAKDFDGMILWGRGGLTGPMVAPGSYQVRLTVGEESQTAPCELVPDPRNPSSPADLQAQLDFLLAARDKLTQMHGEIQKIRDVRQQLKEIEKRIGDDEAGKPVVEAAKALDKKMTAIEEALYQTKNKSPQDPLNYPIRLDDKLANLAESASIGDFAPTAQASTVREELTAAIDAELAKLQQVWDEDLPALNAQVHQADLPAVVAKIPEKEKGKEKDKDKPREE